MATESDQARDDFAEQFQQDLLSEASLDGEERMVRDVFVERMVAELADAGELEDGIACFHQARGVEVSGYNVSTDNSVLDLFGVVLTQTCPPPTVPKAEIEACVRRLNGFLERARAEGHKGKEEALGVFDMFLRIGQAWPEVSKVRLFVFTDGLATIARIPDATIDGVPVSVGVWDIRRLHRLLTSGRRQEPVNVDFVERCGRGIPCLASAASSEYQTLLAVLPGEVLKGVYADFGARLLELNVRSFLQARGKVNQGIRRTILEQPGRFLAYNNGISATASHVDLAVDAKGGLTLRSARDFQIVNGGQTTASLYHAAARDRADLLGVDVQMKLTVVEQERLPEIVPLISRYANSQNRVNDADFSANHPFHVEVEKLSRTVWAPASDGTQRQTRWFYERARGQYQDAIFRAGSPARQRQFKDVHPPSQRFTKTDLAKFELSWDQKPHLVSLGAQKSFTEFTLRLQEALDLSVDLQYFHDLIAKAILFRTTEKVVSSLNLGGYRANVVAYTIALLSDRSGKGLDLGTIWRTQHLTPETVQAIESVAPRVYGSLVNAPRGGNVTEWAKKLDCWQRIYKMDWALPGALQAQVKSDPSSGRRTITQIRPELVETLPRSVWVDLIEWGEKTGKLGRLDGRIAGTMETLAESGLSPTDRQGEAAARALRNAIAKGFSGITFG